VKYSALDGSVRLAASRPVLFTSEGTPVLVSLQILETIGPFGDDLGGKNAGSLGCTFQGEFLILIRSCCLLSFLLLSIVPLVLSSCKTFHS
jgi:hypothetical protein